MSESELAPLYIVAGAPGVGKTTMLPHLIRLADGPVVMEMDEILEDGALLGVVIASPEAEPVWPAYNRMWARFVDIVRRAGKPVIWLCPTPSYEDVLASSSEPGPVRWALVDCADELQRARLRKRGWSSKRIEDAVNDSDQARGFIGTVFRSDDVEPDELAARILRWVANDERQRAERPVGESAPQGFACGQVVIPPTREPGFRVTAGDVVGLRPGDELEGVLMPITVHNDNDYDFRGGRGPHPMVAVTDESGAIVASVTGSRLKLVHLEIPAGGAYEWQASIPTYRCRPRPLGSPRELLEPGVYNVWVDVRLSLIEPGPDSFVVRGGPFTFTLRA